LSSTFDASVFLIHFCENSIWIGNLPSAAVVHLDRSEDAQPSIEAEEDVDVSAKVDEEDEL
jgi:hypothetical protein